MTSSRYDASPAPEPSQRTLTSAERDSLVAQSLADREGPRVSIGTEMTWVGNARHIRAHFQIEDDAYVVVGQIDPDGVVRIMFPTDPSDDGFVRGDRRYETEDTFAGFADQYRFRAQTTRFFNSGYSPDAYDGNLGFVFVIASWRPMHFDQMSSDHKTWDSFELADDSYLNNPRPAIYELAALLAGENREAYTVKFSSYYNTTSYGGYPTMGFASAYNAYCPGFAPSGFGFSPFDNPIFSSFYPYGSSFSYRGSYYQYNYGGDCYTAQPAYFNPFGGRYGYGTGYIATGPLVPTPGRGLINAAGHRTPFTPRPVQPGLTLPAKAEPLQAEAGQRRIAASNRDHFDPQYRNRGLITTDDPSTGRVGPSRREPRDAHIDAVNSRPAIQEMLNRRIESQNEGRRDWSGSQRISNDAGTMRQGWAQRQNANTGQNEGRPHEWQGQPVRTQPMDRGNADQGRVRAPSDVQRSAPRMDTPRMESPHMESPRVSAPPAAAPARSAPPAPPASAGSSSGTPTKP